MHRHKSPVGDHAGNANCIGVVGGRCRARDEVLDSRGVEQLDVGELQDLGQQSRRKEGGVLDDNKVALVLVWHTNLIQEELSRLTHDHGAEELTTEPGTATGSHARLNDGNLEIGALGRQREGGRETTRAGTDNDNVRLGIGVEVGKVAAGHGTRDLRLANGGKGEAVPVVLELSNSLGLAAGSSLDSKIFLQTHVFGGAIAVGGSRSFEHGSRGRHGGACSGAIVIWELLKLFYGGRDRAEQSMILFAGIILIKFETV